MTPDAIRLQALSLPVDERARLAEALLASLDELSEAEIEQLWCAEAVRRAEEADRDPSILLPAETVLAEARALLK